MGKKALCVRLRDMYAELITKITASRTHGTSELCVSTAFLDSVVTTPVVTLADRDECETDETLLQLIPYAIVRTTSGKIVTYTRGKAGDEARLHSKLSIGLGGHIDTEPSGELIEHIQKECAREIMEEIGIEICPEQIKLVGLVFSGATAVDRVHIGILCECCIGSGANLIAETSVIEGVQLLTREELATNRDRLENWSWLALDYLENYSSK